MRRGPFIIFPTVLFTLLGVSAGGSEMRAEMPSEQSNIDVLVSIISLSLREEPPTRAQLWTHVPLDRLNSAQFEQLTLDFAAIITYLGDIRDQHVVSDERHQLLEMEIRQDQRNSLLHLMPLLLLYRHSIREHRLANPLFLAMVKFLTQVELDRFFVFNSFDLSRIIRFLTIIQTNLLNHPYHLFVRDIEQYAGSNINEAVLWIESQIEKQGDVITPEVYYGNEE